MAPARKGRLRNPGIEEKSMAQYIPSPRDWVREQVELYERTNGAEGDTLRDTGLPVIIVTHIGNKTGAIRKTPLMRVKDGENYVLVGSTGGRPKNPVWVYNLRANPQVELRDLSVVQTMRVREVTDTAERERLWKIAEAAYPRFAEYRTKTKGIRIIPMFVAERVSER
jgi:deazaflavin-dependent oxidoreductase (nitroreductase family)